MNTKKNPKRDPKWQNLNSDVGYTMNQQKENTKAKKLCNKPTKTERKITLTGSDMAKSEKTRGIGGPIERKHKSKKNYVGNQEKPNKK